MTSRLVAMRTSQAIFEPSRSRYADTFISYQGQRPSSGAVKVLDLGALRHGGQNGNRATSKPEHLLTSLLCRYWQGTVTQGKAARLMGMRKEDFAELATLRRDILLMERVVWVFFVAQFNYVFPECDRAAVMRPMRRDRPMGARMFTDDQLLAPPYWEPEVPRPE